MNVHFKRMTPQETLALCVMLFGIFVGLTVACLVTTEGLIVSNGFFGTKAYRTPFVGWILWFLGIRNLNAGHIFAMFFIGLAGFSADAITKMSLRPQDHPYGKCIPIFMMLLIMADTALFYLGCVGIPSWYTVTNNWPSVILTVAYCSAIFVFAYVNIYLWNRARKTP